MEIIKSNRGGLRNPPGGRPKKPGGAMVSTSIRLPNDLIEWLKENVENRNEWIVEAIREKVEKEAQVFGFRRQAELRQRTRDRLNEIEARLEKYQNTPQSVGDTDYLPDKIAGDDAPALLAEAKCLLEEKKELLEILERVGKWYKANGVRYVIAEDVWATLFLHTGKMLD